MTYERILYESNDRRARVTINRPDKLNAFDGQTLRELKDAFERAANDDNVGVLVLTGAGERAFCTGADLEEQKQFLAQPHNYWKWFGLFSDAHEKLRAIGKPTIARLNGIVVGGGNEFNMSCDLAVAADDITIRQIGNSRGSVAAGGATQWLPLIVGDRRAREILWLNKPLSAQTALEWGLVNRVVPRAQLDVAVDELCDELLHKMPDVFRYTKAQTNFWKDFAWAMTIQHARDWLTIHADSMEVAEGLDSFFGKRAVDYDQLRAVRVEGTNVNQPWGPYTQTCQHCGAQGIPAHFKFCGNCGKEL